MEPIIGGKSRRKRILNKKKKKTMLEQGDHWQPSREQTEYEIFKKI